mmetsp:Transcript_41522/g.63393  ORF Transcript_41522/g.63393 Transcript_41522/m.63393 type:complete len:92 (-) Transcript_41522:27-302(-)
MPFMDGYQCSVKIQEMLDAFGIVDEADRPRIMAVTGHVESEFQKKAVAAGMVQVYPKPISVDSVARILMESQFKFKVPPSLEKELLEKREE